MNIVIWDIETDSSNTFFGTIIEIGAILINDNFQELDKLNTVLDEEDPCWDGYEMIGYKILDGKKVPNCVKIK